MMLPDRAQPRSFRGGSDPPEDMSGGYTKAALRHAGTGATLGLCAVIALAPLPFGSTDARVIAVWVLLLSLVLLLASVPALGPKDTGFLCGFAVVSLAWVVVVGAQLSQPPAFGRLMPPIWAQASALLGEHLQGSISIARNQPFFSAGSQIACLLSMLGGYLIGRKRHDARMLLMVFLGSALVYAVYGLLALAFWPNYVLWQQKYNYLNSVTATFVNPNVAATYFGAATLGWIILLAGGRSKRPEISRLPWLEWINLQLNAASPRTMICLLICFVMLSTTMLTGSRAGSVLSLLAIAGAVTTYFREELRKRGLLWIIPIVTAVLVVAAITILSPRANQRFGTEGFFDPGRWSTYKSTIKMIADYPWLGSGLGTFKWNFPAYRSGDVPSYGVWEEAHNTTLEIVAEMGIPFALVVGIAWLAVLVVLGRGMLSRNRDAMLPTTAFWIGLLAVAHSQVDFPLQIPGFSLAVCPILGMGMAQSRSSRKAVNKAC
ncbi:O-antigen ligase [Bradyrhizobium jicamae]|uniref:O-antigen ligase family protein n=1 Tax=Bradyrhizobium jicamae TaxID=280332 RepID=UPI001BA632C7|nr:O-antigen ligase family protein [Bradyrhizobium jicamae]MBR0934920.1 O-antigen ligase family protein [Bradyrhizobium jicamae]